jgi:hypothetical protein
MRMPRGILIAGVLLFAASAVSAQTCAGNAPLSAGAWQITAGPGWTSQSTRGLGYVQRAIGSAFVAGGIGVTRFDQPQSTLQLYFGSGGYQFASSRDPRVAFCVIGEMGYINGPNVGTVTIRGVTTEATASLGFAIVKTTRFSLIPSIAISALRNDLTAKAGAASVSQSNTSGRYRVGAGLVFDRHVAILPSFDLPTNGDNTKEFAVLVGITF